jgi:hypothetical protein
MGGEVMGEHRRWVTWMMCALVSCLFMGCAVCLPASTRCNGTLVEVCNADGWWSKVLDCAAMQPGEWQCGWAPNDALGDEGHTCKED